MAAQNTPIRSRGRVSRYLAGATTLVLVLLAFPAVAETPTTLLHGFSLVDGGNPHGSAIQVGDDLYGMTTLGGLGSGVIYKWSTTGDSLSVVYTFTDGTGVYPYGSLAEASGRLYGMTESSAFADANGVLFSVALDGSGYTVLRVFNGFDGRGPHGTPAYSDDVLYGFTADGGPHGGGVAYRYRLSDSTYALLHTFDASPNTGGAHPYGSPLIDGNVLYGMTSEGGTGAHGAHGTVFRVGTDGSSFDVLHSFSQLELNNGAEPYGDLVMIGSELFGMTRLGGSDIGAGKGTVFRLNSSGTGFQILHRFLGPDYNPAGDDDGSEPHGSLTVHGSYLYGMTPFGGSSDRGTIFRIKPDGSAYEVLHSFAGDANDGDGPWYAAPLCEGTTLYAPTKWGGSTGNFGAIVSMNIGGLVDIPERPPGSGRPALAIGAPYPNPGIAGATVVIPVHLPVPDAVVLEMFSPAGRLVASRPAEEFAVAGEHRIRWTPTRLAAGTYYLRVRTSGGLQGGTRWTVIR
jgi:uncharacterized repeat protein (TIGR03803 family)